MNPLGELIYWVARKCVDPIAPIIYFRGYLVEW